jgi:hypothetical protein
MNKNLSDIPNQDLVNEIKKRFSSSHFNYTKAVQHLADARLLVSHLQSDLQTEKQDKEHITKC